MRTTLVIPDPLYRRAKRYARKMQKNLSELFSEALDERLTREEQIAREPRSTYRVKQVSMGVPKVDISDRDRLHDVMSEE